MTRSSETRDEHSLPCAGLSRSVIDALGERLRREAGPRSNAGLVPYIDRIGGRVVLRDFWQLGVSDDSLIVRGRRDFTILVPEHLSVGRTLFAVAHEFGHYVLHYLLPSTGPTEDGLVVSRYGGGEADVEANAFAAAFLMPSAEFRRDFARCGGNIPCLAKEYAMTPLIARLRARGLGLSATAAGASYEG